MKKSQFGANLTQFEPKSDHEIPVFDRVAAIGVVDDCAESKNRKPFFTGYAQKIMRNVCYDIIGWE